MLKHSSAVLAITLQLHLNRTNVNEDITVQNNEATKLFHLSTVTLFLQHQSLVLCLRTVLYSVQKGMSSTEAEIHDRKACLRMESSDISRSCKLNSGPFD